MQCFSYYDLRRPDSIALKAGVTILFLNDTFQSGVMVYLAWLYCVENYSNLFVVYHVRWPYVYIPIGTVLTTTVTHLFMTNRIYCMSRQRCLSGVLAVVSLGSAVTGIVLGIKAWDLTDVREHGKLRLLVSCWLGIQVALDVVIAGFSIFWLHRQRAGSSSKTTSVVDRLIHASLQAGIVPLFFALASLISFVVQPDSNLFITFLIPMGRTYTTFFLNGLNVREELKQRLVGVTDLDFVMSEDAWRRPPLRSPGIMTKSSTKCNLQSTNTIKAFEE